MRRQPSRWQKSLALAVALHATTVLLVSQLQWPASVPPIPVTTPDDPVWLELLTLDELLAAANPPAATTPTPLPSSPAPSRGPSSDAMAPGALAVKGREHSSETRDLDDGSSREPSAFAPSVSVPASPGGEPVGPEGSGPRLSLRELGIGAGNNPFFGPDASAPSRGQVLNQRLRHSLRSGLASHDQKMGLGPEGPAVAAVKSIVLASATTPNTSALLRLRTDADGRTVLVEVVEAANESDGWRRIAEELERALAGKRLRVVPGTGGVSMTLRVASRVQLPSGADPGLAVELFGQTIKEGGGDRSAKLKILTPEISVQEVELPNSGGVKIPVVSASLTLIGAAGDLVDIGAVAQRIVTAYLVEMETHPGP